MGNANWYVVHHFGVVSANSTGELFDLEKLAETCKQLNRWTFFMSSSPFNMKGGISSPPNAQAIF
jgi:hypothetical protein